MFGEWLKSELERRQWTQGELARRSGYDSGQISHWVNGTRTPSVRSCRDLAEALDLPEQVVMEAAGRKIRNPEIPDGVDLHDPAINFVAHNIDQLSPEDRERLLRFMMDLVEKRRKS